MPDGRQWQIHSDSYENELELLKKNYNLYIKLRLNSQPRGAPMTQMTLIGPIVALISVLLMFVARGFFMAFFTSMNITFLVLIGLTLFIFIFLFAMLVVGGVIGRKAKYSGKDLSAILRLNEGLLGAIKKTDPERAERLGKSYHDWMVESKSRAQQ